MSEIETSQFDAWEKAFNEYSENGESISIDKLDSLIFSLGYNPTQEEIEDMKEEFLMQKTIDKRSFLYMIYKHSRYSNASKMLERAFKFFDSDKESKLPYGYIRSILREINHPFTDEQIDQVFAKAQCDGEISIESLVRILLNQ